MVTSRFSFVQIFTMIPQLEIDYPKGYFRPMVIVTIEVVRFVGATLVVAPEVEGNHKGCPYEAPSISISTLYPDLNSYWLSQNDAH